MPVSVTAQASLERKSGFTCLLVFLLFGSTTINFIDQESLSVLAPRRAGSYSYTCFEKARIQHVLMHPPNGGQRAIQVPWIPQYVPSLRHNDARNQEKGASH